MASAHEMPSTNVTINLARFIVVPLLPVLRISDQRRRREAAPATPAVQYVRPSGLGTSPLLGGLPGKGGHPDHSHHRKFSADSVTGPQQRDAPGPSLDHRVMVMSPESSVAKITCGEVALRGTVTDFEPDEVLALTRYLVGPGGSTSVMSPTE